MIVHQNGLCYSNKKYHKGGIRVKKLLLKNAVMLAVVIFCIGSVNCYAATSTGINVNYHSQKEIKDYLKSKKVNIDAETTYSKKASDVKPYQAGTISESSQKSALNTMNAIRYIAGIDAVGLDSSYTKMEPYHIFHQNRQEWTTAFINWGRPVHPVAIFPMQAGNADSGIIW